MGSAPRGSILYCYGGPRHLERRLPALDEGALARPALTSGSGREKPARSVWALQPTPAHSPLLSPSMQVQPAVERSAWWGSWSRQATGYPRQGGGTCLGGFESACIHSTTEPLVSGLPSPAGGGDCCAIRVPLRCHVSDGIGPVRASASALRA